MFFLLSACDSVDKPCNHFVSKGANNSNIYVNKWNWGVNGNSQVIAISDKKLTSVEGINKSRDYVYEGEFPIFLKMENDTLYISTFKKAERRAESVMKGIVIIETEINNLQNMRLRSDSSYLDLAQVCKFHD